MAPQISLGTVRARGVLDELRIRKPSEIVVEAIAWRYGASVRVTQLDGAEGCVVRRGDRGTILVQNGLNPGRYRFTVAHELGHFLLHPDMALKPCTEADLSPWRARHEVEREADEFAAELLLPEALFQPRAERVEPSLDVVEELADEFGSSLTATALRYVELSGFQCAAVVCSDDKIEWFKVAEGFPGWFEKGRAVHGDSWAYEAERGTEMPRGMQPVPATAWFPERRWRDIVLREQAVHLGSYGKVLSLVWVPDEE